MKKRWTELDRAAFAERMQVARAKKAVAIKRQLRKAGKAIPKGIQYDLGALRRFRAKNPKRKRVSAARNYWFRLGYHSDESAPPPNLTFKQRDMWYRGHGAYSLAGTPLSAGPVRKIQMRRSRAKNPAKFDRCVADVKRSLRKRRRKGNAYAICTAAGTRGRRRRRAKNPQRRQMQPKQGFHFIVAKKAGQSPLYYVGQGKFSSDKARAHRYLTKRAAVLIGRHMLKEYPILRAYRVYVGRPK